MRSTLPRRTAAVTALAVATFSGVALAGPALSAAASPRAHTTLSIRSAHGSINPGGSDAITGSLAARGGHVAGRRIVLLSRALGSNTWTKDKVHFTGLHGRVGFEVTPLVTTRYRLAFRGNRFQQGSISGVVQVRVLDTTSLTIAVSADSIDAGQSDTVSGVLSLDGTPLVGQTVKLLRSHNLHGWVKIGSATTAADGSVSFTVSPVVTSHYVLVFARTVTNHGARSAVATVHVRRASSLSIRARSNPHDGTEVVTGNLRGGGIALAHRKVTLQDRPSGTSTWTTVASVRASHNGSVRFAEPAPTASEDYQLVFSGGPLFDGCQSGIVTVTVS
jgi:hypothetical protein